MVFGRNPARSNCACKIRAAVSGTAAYAVACGQKGPRLFFHRSLSRGGRDRGLDNLSVDAVI